jgi:hypothetical protein
MNKPSSTKIFQNSVGSPSSGAWSDTPPSSRLRLILTWLVWNIFAGIGWALVPYVAALLALAMAGNVGFGSAAERSAYLLSRPNLFVEFVFPFAVVWLVIGIIQILCLAYQMRSITWWRLRWLAIAVASGIGLSLFMSFALATASDFMIGMRFTVGYVVWSILTGVGQWLALRGRLRHLHQKLFLLWLGAHCLMPIVIVQLLENLASLLPQSIDIPMQPWHYLIGFLVVLGPGLLHSMLASGGLLLLLRRAQQPS